MKRITVDKAGQLSCVAERVYIKPSPIGLLVYEGSVYEPERVDIEGECLTLHYTCGECTVKIEEKEDYTRLTLLTTPENAQGFVFGPYATDGVTFGELVGTSWQEDGDGWKLTSLMVRSRDLDYGDRIVETEAGTVDNLAADEKNVGRLHHASHVMFDAPYEGVTEKVRFRIRVGEPGCGRMENLQIGGLKLEVTAQGGDYLAYEGDTQLYHYDMNFNLLEVVEGEGAVFAYNPANFRNVTLRYVTDTDEHARYILTEIRKVKEYAIKRKDCSEKRIYYNHKISAQPVVPYEFGEH